jgi:CheY-like chemotaxis protein
MDKKILWIEDDYFQIQALLTPVEKLGFKVEYALTAADGLEKAKKWKDYSLIIVDIILPLRNPNQKLSETLQAWGKEDYPGIGFVKWLLKDMQVKRPIIILSVFDNLSEEYGLNNIGVAKIISKSGLLPSKLLQQLSEYLN